MSDHNSTQISASRQPVPSTDSGTIVLPTPPRQNPLVVDPLFAAYVYGGTPRTILESLPNEILSKRKHALSSKRKEISAGGRATIQAWKKQYFSMKNEIDRIARILEERRAAASARMFALKAA